MLKTLENRLRRLEAHKSKGSAIQRVPMIVLKPGEQLPPDYDGRGLVVRLAETTVSEAKN